MSLSPFAEARSPTDPAGFRHFMARVYLQVVGDTPVGFTGLGLIMVFAPLVILLLAGLAGAGGRAASALVYWSVCATLGVSLSILCLAYADQSLASALLTAAAASSSRLLRVLGRNDSTSEPMIRPARAKVRTPDQPVMSRRVVRPQRVMAQNAAAAVSKAEARDWSA